MTVSSLSTSSITADTLQNAKTVAVPTLPGLLLYCMAIAGQSYFNTLADQGGRFVFLWACVGMVTVFVGCFWSADMYRKLLPEAGTGPVTRDAIRLFLANLAVYSLFGLIGFLLMLFFMLLAGSLIGASGFDPSEASPGQDAVWQSISALSASGGAVVLYVLLFVAAASLAWLGLRLILFGVATVAERHVTIFRSWPWTSRHVARIALLWLFLQVLPWLVLTLVASALMHAAGMSTIFSFYGDTGSPPSEWLAAIIMAAATLVSAPFYWLGHGLAVALYQRLSPNRVDADTTFG